jgi:hypothetical protein
MALSTRTMIASNSSSTVFWSSIEEPRPFTVFSSSLPISETQMEFLILIGACR